MVSRNPRAGNQRWIFSLTESVFTPKIGEQEPIALLVLKLYVGVSFENGAFWTCGLLF